MKYVRSPLIDEDIEKIEKLKDFFKVGTRSKVLLKSMRRTYDQLKGDGLIK